LSKEEAAKHLSGGEVVKTDTVNGKMKTGPSGIGRVNIKTRETGIVVVVPFATGDLYSNPRMPGELFISAETGEGAPQKTWAVRSDGSGLRPLNYSNEVELNIQVAGESGLHHISRSADGRWEAGDDPTGNIYLIDRNSNEMLLLSAGHKTTSAGHTNPSFSPDGKRIVIQSAMLSGNNRSTDICIIPLPEE